MTQFLARFCLESTLCRLQCWDPSQRSAASDARFECIYLSGCCEGLPHPRVAPAVLCLCTSWPAALSSTQPRKLPRGASYISLVCFPNPAQGQRLNYDMISGEASNILALVVWFSWCWWPGSLVGGGCPPVLPRHQEAPARPPHSWQSAPAARQPPPPCHLSPKYCRPKTP